VSFVPSRRHGRLFARDLAVADAGGPNDRGAFELRDVIFAGGFD
jgi:hypothetical protein